MKHVAKLSRLEYYQSEEGECVSQVGKNIITITLDKNENIPYSHNERLKYVVSKDRSLTISRHEED